MFLFLDVASPIPEFHLIKDKKIVYSIKIKNNIDQKLSDLLIPTYLDINNTYKLFKNIYRVIKNMHENLNYSLNRCIPTERGKFRPTEPNVSDYFIDKYIYRKYHDLNIAFNVPDHLGIEGTIITKKENSKVYCYDDYGKIRKRQARIDRLTWNPVIQNNLNKIYVETYSF